MARTTTDPKPNTVAMRLNDEDLQSLDQLAKQWKCSRTDVLRRFLRDQLSTGSTPQLKIGQRVVVHFRPPRWKAGDSPGVIERIAYECRIQLDKPYRPRGGGVIDEMRETFRDPIPIGTRTHAMGHSRHPGRVVLCEPRYAVLLDARCKDTGNPLRYVLPQRDLTADKKE